MSTQIETASGPGDGALGAPVRGALRAAEDALVTLPATLAWFEATTGRWLADAREADGLGKDVRLLAHKGLTQAQMQSTLLAAVRRFGGDPGRCWGWTMSYLWRRYSAGVDPGDPQAVNSRVKQLRAEPGRARSHTPWTRAQEDSLRQLIEQGVPLAEIAAAKQRSVGAITSRAIKLGLIEG